MWYGRYPKVMASTTAAPARKTHSRRRASTRAGTRVGRRTEVPIEAVGGSRRMAPHRVSGPLWHRAIFCPGGGHNGRMGAATPTKALLLDAQAPVASRPLRPTDVPSPVPGPGEILIDVAACG